MVARPRRTVRGKALRLACWNADGVRDRKLVLEHFLSQHGVDICPLNETFLNSGQAFRLANYVCHRTDRPTAGVARPYWSGVVSLTTRYRCRASPSWRQLPYKLCLDIVITRDLPSSVHLISCSALSSDHLPVLIDTMCRSSFQHPPDRPDVRCTDWAKFQTHLEAETPSNLELHNSMDIDTCVENFSGAILGALEATTPKRRPFERHKPPDPGRYSGRNSLIYRLRRRLQVSRDPAQKTEVNRLQMSVTRRLNEWRNDQWSATLESLNHEDQSLWKMTKRVMRFSTPSPLLVTLGGLSQIVRKLKPSPTVWRLSFSRSPFLRSRPSLRWLTWRWRRTSRPLPAKQS